MKGLEELMEKVNFDKPWLKSANYEPIVNTRNSPASGGQSNDIQAGFVVETEFFVGFVRVKCILLHYKKCNQTVDSSQILLEMKFR